MITGFTHRVYERNLRLRGSLPFYETELYTFPCKTIDDGIEYLAIASHKMHDIFLSFGYVLRKKAKPGFI